MPKAAFDWVRLRPFVTPLGMAVVAALMGSIAWEMSGTAEQSLNRAALFMVLAIAFFHATFFACSWATDDLSLRLVDYVYLIIALGAVAAVLDVQAAGMRYDLNDSLPQRITAVEKAYSQCHLIEQKGEFPLCKWESEIMMYVRGSGYVHAVIGSKLESFEQLKEKIPQQSWPFFVALRELYNEMDGAYKRWGVPSNEMEQLRWKLFFIYLFGVGAVIRLCKVTAEVMNWRIQKSAKV